MTVRSRGVAGLAVSTVLLAGCGLPSFGAPDAASEQGAEIADLYRGFFAVAVGVGVFVYALLVYALVRFRRRNDDVPRQNPYNVPIEIAYTVTPLLIVGVLFYFSVRTELSINELSDRPDHVVEVVGFQWQWQFRYLDDDVVVTGTPEQDPVLVLPVDRTTRLELVTTDVNHSFWVPRFLVKRDLIPRVDNELEIVPTETGTFQGHCAEYCGLDHGRMNFTVEVVDGDDFDVWLEEQAGREASP